MRFDRFALKALALLALSHAPLPFQQTSSGSMSPMTVLAEATEGVDVEGKSNVSIPDDAESFAFEAEVSRMLDIVVNSLYQNKDIFLRELISNASDALDKIRFLSLTKPDLLKDEEKLHVQIEYDDDLNTLTIRDTGIGMTHDDLVANLGTVARSGTSKFMEALKTDGSDGKAAGDISQIGQFGVGFYSAFLVSDRIQVASKHVDSPTQNIWTSSNGASEFKIYEDPRGNTLTRGTEITLFLKEDCLEYADKNKITDLARHYSEFITHPISLRTKTTMEVEVEDDEDTTSDEEKKEEDDLEVTEEEPQEVKEKKTKEVTTLDWERLNGNPAIWTRSKEDITDEEYQAFYQVLTRDEREAEMWSHFNAEGNINFKSLLYVPKEFQRPGMMAETRDTGLSLYVRKVLISDEFDLLPSYLNFIEGVVDSDDLPLNVNRETLQESKIIQIIKKKLVRKALEMLKKFQKESDEEAADTSQEDDNEEATETSPKPNKYNEWYKQFSTQLKIGAIADEPNKKKIMKLVRFYTTQSGGELRGLEKYVENMKEWQKEIYFVAGDGIDDVKDSMFLEQFAEKGVEVLYFVDPVDEHFSVEVRDFDGKRFKNIAHDSANLQDDEDDKDLETRRKKFYSEKFKPLTLWLKSMYGSSIMRVSVSSRYMSAPAIVSSLEYGHSANMERLMRAQAYSQGQSELSMRPMRVLEVNPRHPMIIKLLESAPPTEKDSDFEVSKEAKSAALFMLDMALLNGGFPILDPAAHSKRILRFLQSSLGLESLKLESHPELPAEEDFPPEIDGDDISLDMDDLMDDVMNDKNEPSGDEL